MIEKSLAHPAHQTTPDYVWRGRGLFETYREELEYLGGGRWLVPSGSESGKVYEVRVGSGARPERNRCECTGFIRHRHCSHIVCAEQARKKSGICDCCGERRWWKNLTEVQEDHESLTWFPGDRLCGECAGAHGIL